jgi:uncharacterized protein YegL
MSDKNLTDITVVMDRSTSMASCKEESVRGINKFVEEQQGLPGEATFTLVKFDNTYEIEYDGVNIKDVKSIDLIPQGCTAMLDAVGKAINETGARLRSMSEEKRPGLVVFVILTDGQENSSLEFNRDQIKEMIDLQTKKYSWEFTFLGANQDACFEGASIGISSTLTYVTKKTDNVFLAASSNVARMRGDSYRGVDVSNVYSAQEISSVK